MEDPEIEIDRKIDDAEIDREIVATRHVIEGGAIRATGNETLENLAPTTKQNRKEDGRKRKETKKTPMTKRREGRSENK